MAAALISLSPYRDRFNDLEDCFAQTGDQPGSIAIFSKGRQYRYFLKRKTGIPGIKAIAWLMLNPSTADAFKLDPTVTRCLYRSRHHQMTDMAIINLFAMRSPYPKDLFTVDDPIGPGNDWFISQVNSSHVKVVCAWGGTKGAAERAKHVLALIDPAKPLYCLGVTKDGQPVHPLHIAYEQDLIPFDRPV